MINNTEQTKLGISGELCAENYLKKQGFTILEKNYHAKRFGEIDIIAQKKELITFVEVKTRKFFYVPIASMIPKTKQEKIIRSAQHYLLSNRITNVIIRFDVIIIKSEQHELVVSDYITNAFTQKIYL